MGAASRVVAGPGPVFFVRVNQVLVRLWTRVFFAVLHASVERRKIRVGSLWSDRVGGVSLRPGGPPRGFRGVVCVLRLRPAVRQGSIGTDGAFREEWFGRCGWVLCMVGGPSVV